MPSAKFGFSLISIFITQEANKGFCFDVKKLHKVSNLSFERTFFVRNKPFAKVLHLTR